MRWLGLSDTGSVDVEWSSTAEPHLERIAAIEGQDIAHAALEIALVVAATVARATPLARGEIHSGSTTHASTKQSFGVAFWRCGRGLAHALVQTEAELDALHARALAVGLVHRTRHCDA